MEEGQPSHFWQKRGARKLNLAPPTGIWEGGNKPNPGGKKEMPPGRDKVCGKVFERWVGV